MHHYKYLPLEDENSIRLMTVLPGKFDDLIRAEITHEPLVPPDKVVLSTESSSWIHPDPSVNRALYDPIPDGEKNLSVPVYEALFYAWGSPEKREVIEVEVSKTTAKRVFPTSFFRRKLPITHNLALALRHTRFCDRPRTLWVDTICIGQSNAQERSTQVQRMGEIYSLATGVVAWLGPSFTDSNLALTKLEKIGEGVEVLEDNYFALSPRCPRPDWYRLEIQLPFFLNEFAAIVQLCEVPYMKRLWIVQELTAAKISWPLFRRAILCIYSKHRGIPEGPRPSIESVAEICENDQNLTVPMKIYRHYNRQCADARDKVYGCMNLFDPAVKRHIAVDYSKKPLDVFKQVFLVFLGQEKRLTQLPFAGNCTLPASAWPTWLPNWSQSSTFSGSYSGSSSNSISAAREKHTAPNKLEATGLAFAYFYRKLEFLKGLGLEDLQTSTYPNGETRLDVYPQTISTGCLDERNPNRGYPTLAEVRDEVVRLAAYPKRAEQSALAKGFFVDLMIWTADFHVFTMSNDYIGLSRAPVQPGDEVFIILGCDSPMIVRPRSDGEYEVVGDCYIHGAMDGEVLLGALPHSWEVKIVLSKREIWAPRFQNGDSNAITESDPRLDSIPMPAEWEPIEFEWTPSYPMHCRKFQNKSTGEIINSEPRLFPEALLERGIPVKTITLV
ncbi:HET-domain-containing protein [Ustulina deusta]|nr:HET-domain-containing protein [Ustulina deusta]